MKTAAFIVIAVATASSLTYAKNAALVAKGKAIFKVNCETCHGEKADGMGPAGQYMSPHPRNLVKDKFKAGDSTAQIYNTVTNGLPNTAMVGFPQLTDADRHAVAAYVKSLRAH